MTSEEESQNVRKKIFLESREISILLFALATICDEKYVGDFEFFARIGAEKIETFHLAKKLQDLQSENNAELFEVTLSDTELEISYNALNEINYAINIDFKVSAAEIIKERSIELQKKLGAI